MSRGKAPQTDGIFDAGGFHYCPVYGQKLSPGGQRNGWLREDGNYSNYFKSLVGETFLSFVADINTKLCLPSRDRDRLQAEQNWTAETNWFLLGTGLAPGYQLMKFSDQFYILSPLVC